MYEDPIIGLSFGFRLQFEEVIFSFILFTLFICLISSDQK